MTLTLRRIDGRQFADPRQPLPPHYDPGEKPQLRWIAIDLLRIDPSYQREIFERGAKNVRKIAREFSWAKFGTVIVSEADQGIFLVIDGQHRTTGAALRGIKDVPCQIVKISTAMQATAFAAINSNVTALTAMHLYHARVVAGDEDAVALAAVLADADVAICHYPVPAKLMKPGETLAAGKLPLMLKRYGPDVLRSALRCITRTKLGNPGCLRAAIIDALCVTLDAEPDWLADEKALIRAMQTFNFGAEYHAACKRSFDDGMTVTAALIESLGAHLEERLEAATA